MTENVVMCRSWFTLAIMNLQLQRNKNCIELRCKSRLCKRETGQFDTVFLRAIPKILKQPFSWLSFVESTWNFHHLLDLDWCLLLLLFWKNRFYHDNGKQQILKS